MLNKTIIKNITLVFHINRLRPNLTLGVQEACHPQVSLCHIEGLFQVLLVGLLVHSAHVNESGTGGTQTWTINYQLGTGRRVRYNNILICSDRTPT